MKVTRLHRFGLPVLRLISSCRHAVATTPAGWLGSCRSYCPQQRRPSPFQSRVGSRVTLFEACSAFTHVTACRLAESPMATLYLRGFGNFVTSIAAPMATGWSDQLAGRDSHPLKISALSRRTLKSESGLASGPHAENPIDKGQIGIGRPSRAVPATPPCVRVRTRRFDRVVRSPSHQTR